MPLIACPDCAAQVSDAAPACPGCARPMRPVSTADALGVTLLLLPLGATVLIWTWVAQMNLLQGPSSALGGIGAVTVVASAALVGVDASSLGMGSRAGSNGKPGSGPVVYAVATLLLWLFAFPTFFFARSRFGRRNMVVGAALVALVFAGSWAFLAYSINEQAEKVQHAFDGFASPRHTAPVPDTASHESTWVSGGCVLLTRAGLAAECGDEERRGSMHTVTFKVPGVDAKATISQPDDPSTYAGMKRLRPEPGIQMFWDDYRGAFVAIHSDPLPTDLAKRFEATMKGL